MRCFRHLAVPGDICWALWSLQGAGAGVAGSQGGGPGRLGRALRGHDHPLPQSFRNGTTEGLRRTGPRAPTAPHSLSKGLSHGPAPPQYPPVLPTAPRPRPGWEPVPRGSRCVASASHSTSQPQRPPRSHRVIITAPPVHSPRSFQESSALGLPQAQVWLLSDLPQPVLGSLGPLCWKVPPLPPQTSPCPTALCG